VQEEALEEDRRLPVQDEEQDQKQGADHMNLINAKARGICHVSVRCPFLGLSRFRQRSAGLANRIATELVPGSQRWRDETEMIA
jgi:hypothetical protein